MIYSNILIELNQHVDRLLDQFMHNLYSCLTHYLHWPFFLCLQLYLIFIGYGILNGWFSVAWRSMASSLYKVTVSIVLMTQWEFISSYIIHPLLKVTDELSLTILSIFPNQSSGSSMIESSQQAVTEIARVGLWLWHGGSLIHYSRLFAALCVWVCGLGATLYGIVHMIIAHMVLYIMLGLSPLFVVFSLFRYSSYLTWYWVGVCVECVLLIVFMSSVMALSMSLIRQVFDLPYSTHTHSFKLVDVIPIVIVSSLSFTVMRRMLAWSSFVASGIVSNTRSVFYGDISSRVVREFSKGDRL